MNEKQKHIKVYCCAACDRLYWNDEGQPCKCASQQIELVKPVELKPSLLTTPVARTAESRHIPRLLSILDKKQSDYGPDNIRRHGQLGIIVRIDDKTSRLAHLLRKQTPALNEPILDSWDDIANYGIIGGMVARGEWPEK